MADDTEDRPLVQPPGRAGGFSEDEAVEVPATDLLGQMGWEVVNLQGETEDGPLAYGRTSFREVFLPQLLIAAIERLNPGLPTEAVEEATDELTRDRSFMLAVDANREIYGLLKSGVPVKIKGPDSEHKDERVQFIDWRNVDANHFLVVRQFWVRGELYTRRTDAVGFVNGIPLLFAEFKAPTKDVRDAYDDNLTDYRDTIPQLFVPNGFVVLSNGREARVGATFASWDYFVEWKRLDEDDEGNVALATLLRGTCAPERFLDLIENFVVFERAKGGLVKKLAKNHQYLGVNKAIASLQERRKNRGQLGVFWHTQGAGKSLSMLFFTQKVLRTIPGDWSFVIVTDRDELDNQIAGTFVACDAVKKEKQEVQAQTRKHLKTLLQGNERYIFTLIHKFGVARGETMEELSARDDVIVITDEAHRSQYDILAANMRKALPNAAFMGFTGTPLMAGEEKTREVFGDYVSIYDFVQSVEDEATVPLYYENRIPELQLTNENLEDELAQLVEDAELDQDQEAEIARRFAKQYHLITRDDRLERIAEDVVQHFSQRGYRGKAMYIAIDKATAVRMYDKVREHWETMLAEEEKRVAGTSDEERAELQANLDWLQQTDMAVVVSSAQNEQRDMAAKGLDIVPHRKRVQSEDMDEKFKDPNDPFRLVFVCAMWVTGFDVPTCSTIYIDKPMKNHTLMQTIARANRVAPGKEAGVIVDYVGVFRNLQQALAIYGRPGRHGGDLPVKDKAALLGEFRIVLDRALEFCRARNVEPRSVLEGEGFDRIRRLEEAEEALRGTDEEERQFHALVGNVWAFYKALLPDPSVLAYAADVGVLRVLCEIMRRRRKPPDVSGVMADVEELLDASIIGVKIPAPILKPNEMDQLFDLSKLDFDKLAETFKKGKRKTELQKLRARLEGKAREMAARNPSRVHFLERLQKLIDAYNAGSLEIEKLFEELLAFMRDLNEEDQRAIREELSEEELAILDILTKPEPALSEAEKAQVKKVAKTLLAKLKQEKLVLDWRRKEQAKAAVRSAIRDEFEELPEVYDRRIWNDKVERTYQYLYEHPL